MANISIDIVLDPLPYYPLDSVIGQNVTLLDDQFPIAGGDKVVFSCATQENIGLDKNMERWYCDAALYGMEMDSILIQTKFLLFYKIYN